MIRSRVSLIGVVVLALAAQAAQATTYFVRVTGNDASAGTAPATAFRTITKAMAVAGAGDTVYIGAGTYAAALSASKSGTAVAPIIFAADLDGSRTGDAGAVIATAAGKSVLTIKNQDYLTYLDIEFRSGTEGVSIQNSDGTTLLRCTVRNCTGDAVSVTNSGSIIGTITVDGCTITNCSGSGLVVNQNATVVVRDTSFSSLSGGMSLLWPNSSLNVNRCILSSISGRAVNIDRGVARLSNILAVSCAAMGVRVGSHSSVDVKMVNTTIAAVSGPAVKQEGGVFVMHNVVVAGSTTGFQRTGGTTTHSHNLYYNCPTTYSGVSAGSSDLIADPKFAGLGDYRPLTDSPAVDSGFDASSLTATDLDRKPRPLGGGWDRGCYEFGTVPSLRILQWNEIEPN
ncbi:MAG: right-handed parallel beta-helix repeat-containing protein [Phycisphaeraceae bacterium]|nr:right-handed parallel beta-helix repeat-containing protein [Phycisphaeraceae bacterium]